MKKKIVAMCATVAIAAIAVGGTLAYFTDTKTAENTFTVGDIEITLDETNFDKKDASGNDNSSKDRDTANSYQLIPGTTYTKDPVVTVVKGSEPCYVRLLVTVDDYDDLKAALRNNVNAEGYPYVDSETDIVLLQNLVSEWDSETWVFKGFDSIKHEYEFRYCDKTKAEDNGIVDARGQAVVLDALFDDITIPTCFDDEDIETLNQLKVYVKAEAIQSANFTADGTKSAEDVAWEAFDAQESAA